MHTEVFEQFMNHIAKAEFPCVMAKAVMSKGRAHHQLYHGQDLDVQVKQAFETVKNFVTEFRKDSSTPSSFVISFADSGFQDFQTFENYFWNFLNQLQLLDREHFAPDPRVSAKPDDQNFSFSLAGEAFFILVLHPESPRFARRFSTPTIVFNAHAQFEDLRKKGIFTKVRDLIRKRDISLQGFINPMLKDHGQETEALQYTGRVYESQGQCPFLQAKRFFQNAFSLKTHAKHHTT